MLNNTLKLLEFIQHVTNYSTEMFSKVILLLEYFNDMQILKSKKFTASYTSLFIYYAGIVSDALGYLYYAKNYAEIIGLGLIVAGLNLYIAN